MLTTAQIEQMSIVDIKDAFTGIMEEIVTEYGDNQPDPSQPAAPDSKEEVQA